MIYLICLALLVLTTIIHYEILTGLSSSLPSFRIPARTKLIIVIFGTFLAHAMEIVLYSAAIYFISHQLGWGKLGGINNVSFNVCVYFSTETFTSLGFGDIVPNGKLRLLSGAEALNGLLLIGWSASYSYIAMERFWAESPKSRNNRSNNSTIFTDTGHSG
jgi:Ion channel